LSVFDDLVAATGAWERKLEDVGLGGRRRTRRRRRKAKEGKLRTIKKGSGCCAWKADEPGRTTRDPF
jgi:hypothetical protein